MTTQRKSYRGVVPKKRANNEGGAPSSAESVEERPLTKGNPPTQNSVRTQERAALRSALERIRQVAERDKEVRFTTLWHHVYNVERLREAFLSLKRKAAAGVDGQTWQTYRENLEENLEDLSARLKRGAYKAYPVARVYIPKPDGRKRPIGIPALEDKIVQKATVEVLNAVYETDFTGFSYGFRPKRSQHNALDAVTVGIERRKVNWVLDADISGFFDAIDHEWLMRFVEHRIADKRVLRHIKKWLYAGVLEEKEWRRAERGTPQGGSISPLLANIYLHYALDLWAHQWRRSCRGDLIIVRYADDFIVGFQHRHEAERFRRELSERLSKFKLELHPEKTRLIEFGRYAAERRQGRGKGKPETFNFLGFTHICGKTRDGRFTVRRKTMSKRLGATLKAIRAEMRRRMHHPIPEVGAWLRSVLLGYYRYHGVPGNFRVLASMRDCIYWMWRKLLRRRSQKAKVGKERMRRITDRWLPRPRIYHPYPAQRLRV
jgi:RNA-directed DNA polymerase